MIFKQSYLPPRAVPSLALEARGVLGGATHLPLALPLLSKLLPRLCLRARRARTIGCSRVYESSATLKHLNVLHAYTIKFASMRLWWPLSRVQLLMTRRAERKIRLTSMPLWRPLSHIRLLTA